MTPNSTDDHPIASSSASVTTTFQVPEVREAASTGDVPPVDIASGDYRSAHFPIGSITAQCAGCLNEVLATDLEETGILAPHQSVPHILFL